MTNGNTCDAIDPGCGIHRIVGELFDESAPSAPGTGQQFMLMGRGRLSVGWQVFEVYPPFDPSVWQESVAPVANPVSTTVKNQLPRFSKNMVAAAEAMPAEKY